MNKNQINYQKLSVLVADDFSNFRGLVGGMLNKLGVYDIHVASSSEEAIRLCEKLTFDVILCDYDLGEGKNGQHVLEELRYRNFIDRSCIFVIVSAEASRNIVMSAYDCAPDDYLMKPITERQLKLRLERLLMRRKAMNPVYSSLAAGDQVKAKALLTDMSVADNRYSVLSQKLLGELFLQHGEYDKAERLYSRALEVRSLDWARLGLACAKQHMGDLELAESWLEEIIQDNPLYLPAYDALAKNWKLRHDNKQLQGVIQRAVEISPLSILRQKNLGQIALKNEAIDISLDAFRRTIKLGRHSCYGEADDFFALARAAAVGLEKELITGDHVYKEALNSLSTIEERHTLNPVQKMQAELIAGRLHAVGENPQTARNHINGIQIELDELDRPLDLQLDRVALMNGIDDTEAAKAILEELSHEYSDDETALEKLDEFLAEPLSQSNQDMITAANHEGIRLYNEKRYDEAVACFEKARIRFPKDIGINLNIAQTLISKAKAVEDNAKDSVVEQYQLILKFVETIIKKNDPQYDRYLKLRKMA